MDIAKIRKKAQLRDKQKGPGQTGPSEVHQAGPLPEEQSSQELIPEPVDRTTEPVLHDKVLPALPEHPEDLPSPVSNKQQPVTETAAASPANGNGLTELLTFSLDEEEFAFKVADVEEIIRHQKITYVPTTPSYVRGITSLRGKVIPVLDIKKRLAQASSSSHAPADDRAADSIAPDEKIVILTCSTGLIGVVVDQVNGVISLPPSDILEPPSHLTEAERIFLEGVVILNKRFISIFSIDEALSMEIM